MTKSKEHCISIGRALYTKNYDAIIAISGDGGFIDLLMGMAENCDDVSLSLFLLPITNFFRFYMFFFFCSGGIIF